MRKVQLSMALMSMVLAGAVASAQPPPPTQQPVRPQPQDPTPVPDPKPAVPRPTQEPPRPAAGGQIGGDSTLVVTGCLQRAAAAPGQKSGGSLAGGFVLKQAAAKPNDDGKAATAQGRKEYRIVAASDDVKLAEHVGHQVEVTGKISMQGPAPARDDTAASQSSSKPSGSTGVAVTPPPDEGANAAGVALSVSSLKMVAATCSAPAD